MSAMTDLVLSRRARRPLAATAVIASGLFAVVAPPPPVAAAQPAICSAAHPTLLNGSFEDIALVSTGANTVQASDPALRWTVDGSPTVDLYKAGNPPDIAADQVNYADVPANGSLYQDIDVVPGETIHWYLYHRTDATTPDDLTVQIGPAGGTVTAQVFQASSTWTQYRNTYTVPLVSRPCGSGCSSADRATTGSTTPTSTATPPPATTPPPRST